MAGDNSGGYQVEPSRIRAAGQAAIRIGEAISALANDVDGACTISPAPAGLDVGSTLLAIDPLWQQHFRAVGDDVQQTGQTLAKVSRNYSATESKSSATFRGILS